MQLDPVGIGESALTREDPLLLNFLLPSRQRLKAQLPLTITVAALVLFTLWRLKSPTSDPYALVAIAIPLVFVLALYRFSSLRSSPHSQSQPGRDGTDCEAERARLREFIEQLLPHSRFVGKQLATAGFRGAAVRIGRPGALMEEPIAPLAVPVEPLPLEESAEEMLALAGEWRLPDEVRSKYGKNSRELRRAAPRAWRRRLLRWVWPAASVCLMLWMFEGLGLKSASFTLLVAACGIQVLSFRRSLPPTNLYITPGGLVDTKRRRIYRRSLGVMVWYPEQGEMEVTNADEQDVLDMMVSPAEAKLALRAWLSPLREPTDDMICSFFGDGQSN